MNLTIFQKMLIGPAVAIALYCAYLYATYVAAEMASTAIESIQDDYVPAMELAGENVLLFDSIVTQMKDAVSAGEVSWLDHSQQNRDQILDNLSKMERHQGSDPAEELKRLRENFNLYYRNAYALSLEMLGHKDNIELRNTLVENVERYYRVVSEMLSNNKRMVQERVHRTVQLTKQRLIDLLIVGVSFGVLMILIVIGLTFSLTMTTRKSFSEVTDRMKDLAQGHPDFSKRLVQHSKDELGALVDWFNLLSDKLEQDYKKIERLSITDKLTKLYNRTKIDQLLADELKRAERYQEKFSLILIDLDDFKSVNDNYGHSVGDTVLQELSQLLTQSVRETDYVGRWGGEEFVAISPNTDMARAMQLAEKLRKSIDEYAFSEVGHKTASFGAVSFRAGDDAARMMLRVDAFLYRAKAEGKNRVIGESEND